MADYKALYRKWRPFDFDDVCGQNAITDILKYEVASSKVSHAYLFCGSRGTGKTSCAKILAKAVNCESPVNGNPCNKCEACRSIDAGIATDVIEMDAASNNGVDNVRNLKDEIAFTPALLKYRVYIIDEVHMMTGQAFNALLKTLEEPPSYVVFILATTEYNKLPTTIVSRCQRFDFRRISSDVIVERLMKIAAAEGIDLTDDGARLIARASRGGLRDAVSLLELAAGSKARVDAALVASVTGVGDRDTAYQLIASVARSDFSAVYSAVRDIVMGSGDISVFWQEIIDAYRDIMVIKNTERARSYLDLTDGEFERVRAIAQDFTMARLSYHAAILEGALSDMQRATNSKRSIAEIALTRMCDPKISASPEALVQRIEELEKQVAMLKMGVSIPAAPVAESTAKADVVAETEVKAPEKAKEATTANAPQTSSESGAYSAWGRVLERVAEIKRSLSSQFVGAKVTRSGNSFTVAMSDFFASRLASSPADLAIVKGAIAEKEGISPADVVLNVVSKASAQGAGAESDLDKIFS